LAGNEKRFWQNTVMATARQKSSLWRKFRDQKRIHAIADQALQGGANILASAILARALIRADFGALGIAVGLYYLVAGFHRSNIVLPYIAEMGAQHLNADPKAQNDWFWMNMIGIGLVTLAITVMVLLAAGAGIVRPDWHWIIKPTLLAACITPPLLLAEYGRRWLYQTDRSFTVMLSSIAYFMVMTSTAILVGHFRPVAGAGALTWVAASAVSAAVSLTALRPTTPRWASAVRCWLRNRHFALWQSATHIPYSIYNNASVVVLIGFLLGPLPAAVFTAARTLINPAISIVSAVDSLDKPRAARALASGGIAALRHSVNRTRMTLIALTGSYLGLVALLATVAVRVVFANKYPGIDNELRLLALAFFLMCLNQPSETFLIVIRAGPTLFAIRAITAIVTIVALAAARPWGLRGMAIGILLSQTASLFMLIAAERLVSRRISLRSPVEADIATP